MSKINKIPDFLKMSNKLIDDVMTYAEVQGVNHFKRSFRNQGFTEETFEPWNAIKNPLSPARAILVNSGYLRDSIQVFDSNKERIVFGSDAQYAEIHNSGGTMKIRNTPKAKRFFWYMFKKTGEARWKWMALSKKSHFKIHIPKRQFIGESKTLMDKLDNWVIQQIEHRFKQL